MENNTPGGTLPQIRKAFFAMRNGMIADTLRKGGLEQKYIFGLQLPQIKELAERFRPDTNEEAAQLARTLWADSDCREARLTACFLMPPSAITEEEAHEWALSVATREEADILAFRLLRYLPFAGSLAESIEADGTALRIYSAEAIRRFL